MKKKTLATITISSSLVSIIALGVLAISFPSMSKVRTAADNVSYTMTIDKNSHQFNDDVVVSGEGTGTIVNQRGNAIQFRYNALSAGDTETWQVMETYGYLRNISPINGITSIEITTYGKHAFNIYYGASYEDVDNNHITIESAVTNHTYDLSALLPNFFKITPHAVSGEDPGALMIMELNINYGCVQTNCWVNATSATPELGTVTGGGTYTVGEPVTLTASPIIDYENKVYAAFHGWYDGETKLSDNLTYTFTPTIGTYSYNYQARILPADKEEYTSATRLYYSDSSTADPIAALESKSGEYFLLVSFDNWSGQDGSVDPDGQPYNEEGKVFISRGHGEDRDTNDIYLNRQPNLDGYYFKGPNHENHVYARAFDTDIKSIDFYIDISDENNMDGNELTATYATLHKYDIVGGKCTRVTLSDFEFRNSGGYYNWITINVPDHKPVGHDLIISKVVIHYTHA